MSTVSFVVRMPPEVRGQLTELAKKEERSMNWLIVSFLKQGLVSTNARTENAPTGANG